MAGTAKGLAGTGLPLIATPILAGVFGPRTAVVIMSVLTLLSNSLLLITGRRRVRPVLREAAPLLLLGAVGTILGVQLLALLDQRVFALVISALVLLFLAGGERALGGDPDARRIRLAAPLIGFAGGVLNGSTSISGPLVGSYFHARRLSAQDFVVALATVFELYAIVQIGAFILTGLLTPPLLALGMIGLVPNLLGLIVGIELRGRVSEVMFRRIIVVILVASVTNLLWKTFAG